MVQTAQGLKYPVRANIFLKYSPWEGSLATQSSGANLLVAILLSCIANYSNNNKKYYFPLKFTRRLNWPATQRWSGVRTRRMLAQRCHTPTAAVMDSGLQDSDADSVISSSSICISAGIICGTSQCDWLAKPLPCVTGGDTGAQLLGILSTAVPDTEIGVTVAHSLPITRFAAPRCPQPPPFKGLVCN